MAISRTEDYRHHWQDVTIGAILGTLCAYFAYRQYYPGLSQDSCRDPYLTRLAHCKRGHDVEAVVCDAGTHNIALVTSNPTTTTVASAAPSDHNKFGVNDTYSDDASSHDLLDHSNSRIPLVGRGA